jgi:TatD DNase family protein
MLIDTHCHIDEARFDNERAAMLARARATGVERFVTIGCDIANSERALGLASVHPDVYFSAGIHPHEAGKAPDDFAAQLKVLAMHPRCVAIGECGLDYYYDNSPKEAQRTVFLAQIALARELAKPLVIHVRDAWDECIDILGRDEYKGTRAIIHCFTGTKHHAEQFTALGCVLSISGIVTFKDPGELALVAKDMPLEQLLVETDSPYLAPIPHRGKRNEPAYVRVVAEKIAELKGITLDEVIAQTGQNANRIFGFA